ncbi:MULTISPECIES: right-handed parallel beta-helix repeat-containing protein [Rhodomicrobium]|uniref:right-handed parallel beta-helix repeat-containing protein n=1 Tax=Rhodomicrobium TaxID=1068 RepID=UPI000B4B526B|nr:MULTISPECIES: right-handed parallel beta-helix repeat-containing protein [Rhodomicrobium]
MPRKDRVAAILMAGCVSCVGGLAPAEAQDAGTPEGAAILPGDKFGPWIEFGGFGSNRSDAERGEATLWAPLMQDGRSLVFTDIRGSFMDETTREGNFALGFRYVGDNGWNPGVWVSYDRLHSQYGQDFNQISFGLEALSANYDLRLNGYAPVNTSEFVSNTTTAGTGGGLEVIDGDLLFVPGLSTLNSLYELAFWGLDGEVGFRVPLERFGFGFGLEPSVTGSLKDGEAPPALRYNDLRIFVGGYYFDHDEFRDPIAGPRVRAEWRVENFLEDWQGSRLTFEAGYQTDDVRDDQVEVGLRLRIPLGGKYATPFYALSPQERRMTEGLRRDRDIVTETRVVRSTLGGGPPQPVEDAVTGVDFDSITFVQNGVDLTAALAAAGGNALLVAFGGATNFGPTVMVANQTLLGGGGLLQVRSRTTGLLYTYAAPGTRPTFQADQAPGITAANNAHIKSVNITGGAIGILAQGPDRVVVDDANITGSVFGLSSNGSGSTLTVRNSFISGGSAGIVSGDSNQTLLIENNVFDNLGTGVVIGDASGGVTSANITAIGNTFTGAFTNYLLTFPNGTVNQLAGSVGNVDATTVSNGICIRDFFMTLNGSIQFVGGQRASATTCAIP